jgi:DNA-binding transcriptional LysR family regulator
LLPNARRILDELDSSFDSLRRSGRRRVQRIAIGCLPTIAHHHLPGPLREFARRFPEIEVKVHDNSAAEIAELVRNDVAEFGVSIVSTNRMDLDIRPLLTEPFVLACPSDHPFVRRGAVDWSELEGQALVRISPQAGNRALIDDALGGRRESLRWRYEVQHAATAIGMVGAGLGLAIVPRLAVDAVATPAVVAVRLRNPAVSRPLGILTRRGVAPSEPAQALADLVAKSFKTRR